MCTAAMITVTGGFSKQSKYHIIPVGYHSGKLEHNDNDTMNCEVTWV